MNFIAKRICCCCGINEEQQILIGKFDKNLTGEKFVDYQRRKGTIFGIVGKRMIKLLVTLQHIKPAVKKLQIKTKHLFVP